LRLEVWEGTLLAARGEKAGFADGVVGTGDACSELDGVLATPKGVYGRAGPHLQPELAARVNSKPAAVKSATASLTGEACRLGRSS
jgi:hypothetical protein